MIYTSWECEQQAAGLDNSFLRAEVSSRPGAGCVYQYVSFVYPFVATMLLVAGVTRRGAVCANDSRD